MGGVLPWERDVPGSSPSGSLSSSAPEPPRRPRPCAEDARGPARREVGRRDAGAAPAGDGAAGLRGADRLRRSAPLHGDPFGLRRAAGAAGLPPPGVGSRRARRRHAEGPAQPLAGGGVLELEALEEFAIDEPPADPAATFDDVSPAAG